MVATATWITRANALTGLRAVLAPPLAVALLGGHALPALALFALAVATDFADGWVARRYGETSQLGRLADHGVDALLVTAASAALAVRGLLPAALPGLIAVAFCQYALDSRAHRGAPLRASPLGRWNGIAYYAIVGTVAVRDALDLGWPGDGALRGLGWALVASTLLSMGERLRSWRRRAPPAP